MVEDVYVQGRMLIPEQWRKEIIFYRKGDLYCEFTYDINSGKVTDSISFENTPEHRLDIIAHKVFVAMCQKK